MFGFRMQFFAVVLHRIKRFDRVILSFGVNSWGGESFRFHKNIRFTLISHKNGKTRMTDGFFGNGALGDTTQSGASDPQSHATGDVAVPQPRNENVAETTADPRALPDDT